MSGNETIARASQRRAALVSSATLIVIVVGATSWSQPDVDSSDLWWHLASGRHIWEQGFVPRADVFSHTALGSPWLNAEWLWGLLTWLAYRQLPDLVAWLNLALVAATFALVAQTARRVSQSWLIAGAVTWIAAANCHWFFDIRPHLVSLFFAALLLATLHWRRAPWLWAPVIAVWANLHAGFVFGLGLLGLHLLIESIRVGSAKPFPWKGWIGLAAAMLAVAINPWGFVMYTIPLHVVDPSTPFRDLIEWHPLRITSLDPQTYSGRFLWTLLVASPALLRARRDPFHVALALVAVVMAFSARRFVGLAAVAAAPAMALGLASAWAALCRRLPSLETNRARISAVAAAAGVAALLWQDIRLAPNPLYRWTRLESHVSGAVSYLNGVTEPPKRLFNFYNWGGFLSLHARSTAIFIDGRAATVYSDKIVRDYLTLDRAGDDWRRLLTEYGIDAVLVPPGSPLARAVRRESPPWRLAHVDTRSVLLLPPGPVDAVAEASALSKLSKADAKLRQAYIATSRGNTVNAQAALAETVGRKPLQLHAYGDLMLLAARQNDSAEIRKWLDAALLTYPRRSNRIWAFAERAWLVAGRPKEHLEALDRIHLGSPFIPEQVLRDFEARVDRARKLADEEER